MFIDKKLLDEVTERAKASERLRMNYNLHDSLEAKAQRLLNALEPGTQLPIHRHRHTAETYIVLRGAIKVLFYDENKMLTDEFMVRVSGRELWCSHPGRAVAHAGGAGERHGDL